MAKVKRYKIVILPGDGIDPEVIESALSVLDVISRKYNFEIDWQSISDSFNYHLMKKDDYLKGVAYV